MSQQDGLVVCVQKNVICCSCHTVVLEDSSNYSHEKLNFVIGVHFCWSLYKYMLKFLIDTFLKTFAMCKLLVERKN
jgi:hypothetical protein